jgi:hypothetical protein
MATEKGKTTNLFFFSYRFLLLLDPASKIRYRVSEIRDLGWEKDQYLSGRNIPDPQYWNYMIYTWKFFYVSSGSGMISKRR